VTGDVEVTFAEGDGTTKVDRFTGPAATQVWDGGRAMVWLLDGERRVVGWAQYTRVSRIVAGTAVTQLRAGPGDGRA